ncbi:LysE family translocator [Burkholderia cepacia]|uniref:LysE family translocator n=1 Tax=Burkholderia cepacia TaxID=292 RepID=A0AAX2RJ45_BURCE|nr:LysE family translocator [Burkholderia cepacia]TES61917.1 LysE family translocator [Burkholderia cepacia]TES97783.1 LysE family translocator [Burkholderia cepacia]TEU34266.1 LysE family translocator [Burkholderia cepacia]TEU36369.1 LysE family translocator [Burkholderia cepacia]TEU43696.1 LysE family translocator [Burkholderia cepacia]
MSFRLYLSFLAASAVLVYAPGPVNLLTMNHALRAGWRRALPCVWGGTLAVLMQLALTALCLNSLVHLDERALTVLRWAGAAYLVWLGCKQWLSRTPAGAPATAAGPAGTATPEADSHRALFWRGLATSGLNPKTLLFFPSFFPQFIVPDADWSLNQQFLLLSATFAVLFAGGVASMALFSHRLSRALQRPARMRAMNRVTGGLLVGMGAIMAGWN